MFSTIFNTVFYSCLALVSLSCGVSWAQQEEGKIIVLSPEVGSVIDRDENQKYRLFESFADFRSATFRSMPDRTISIEITYSEDERERKQTWRVTRQAFFEDYRRKIRDDVRVAAGVPGEFGRAPLIHIETLDGEKAVGYLQTVSDDSLVVSMTDQEGKSQWTGESRTMRLSDIHRLSLPRTSTFSKNLRWGLVPGGIGILLGLASGNDNSGFIRFSAAQKATALGILLGGPGLVIGGSLGAQRAVDIDVPWQGMSNEQRRAALTRIGRGTYRSRSFLRACPWVAYMSPPRADSRTVFGGRLRYHFTPRSGIELAYGRSAWSTRTSPYPYGSASRTRYEYLNAGFFVSTTWKRAVNPFVAWGIGRVTRRSSSGSEGSEYSDSSLALHGALGVDVPITRFLTMEARLSDILALGDGGHQSIQLAFNFGPH